MLPIIDDKQDMGNRYEKAKALTNKQFKRIIGVKQATFEEMKEILEVAYAEKHKRYGYAYASRVKCGRAY